MDEKAGRFFVTTADDTTVVLSDVSDGQVIALSSNPGLEPGEVVEGTVSPDPPLGVTWTLIEVAGRHRIAVEAVDEPPGDRAKSLANPLSAGEVARDPVDGGELHVFCVPPDATETAVESVVADEATRRRAAWLGARRAEVRGAEGVVSVRYLDP